MGRPRKIRPEESETSETTEQVMEQAVVSASPVEAIGPLGIVELNPLDVDRTIPPDLS